MSTDNEDRPETRWSDARPASGSGREHSSEASPQRAAQTQRDFLYQRRLVSLRPFVADDGVPGFNLRFEGDEMIAMRIEMPLLDIFHQAIGRLKENPRIKR